MEMTKAEGIEVPPEEHQMKLDRI